MDLLQQHAAHHLASPLDSNSVLCIINGLRQHGFGDIGINAPWHSSEAGCRGVRSLWRGADLNAGGCSGAADESRREQSGPTESSLFLREFF